MLKPVQKLPVEEHDETPEIPEYEDYEWQDEMLPEQVIPDMKPPSPVKLERTVLE